MISPRIAGEVLWYMGLKRSACEKIVEPLEKAVGLWRLPFSASASPQPRSRGLPQGMSSSVLLSEAFLSAMLWKLTKTLRMEVIGYVDDLTLLTSCPLQYRAMMRQVKRFSDVFALVVNAGKTCVWGTDKRFLQEIASEEGFVVASDVQGLGAEWNATGAYSVCAKKNARISEISARLKRLAVLPAGLHVKIPTLSVGCLSMLDYVGMPKPTRVLALRGEVKRALNLIAGAPEIVLHAMSRSSLDPYTRWIVNLMHIWHEAAKHEEAKPILDDCRGPHLSRFTSLKCACKKMGWEVSSRLLTTPFGSVPFHRPWDISRPTILSYLKQHAWRHLERRRPATYAGLGDVFVEEHVKLMKTLNSYQQVTIARVWAGCPMSLSHKKTLDPTIDDTCPCGNGPQTIVHLLFSCELLQEFPGQSSLQDLTPSFTSALIFSRHLPLEMVGIWRQACWKIIDALSYRAVRLARSPIT